ncbi:GNAT family N-acetyltransferase [Lyngbya aestuarii]|uniref:GNAT family N-acetyltransferase n=1 Tax=Lyngbya aestuarii TaxID=118322 RepID=UPI00403DA65C
MASQLEYSAVSNPQELQQLGIIDSQCFGTPPTDAQRYLDIIGRENFRLIRQGGQVIGGLAIYPLGQWYGGFRVPMAGIAAVGIAPEYRGTGAAYYLMSQTLQELNRLEVPISVLYAATQGLYRKVGYEQGGIRCRWELPVASINLRERHLPLHQVNPVSYEVFEQIYKQQAQANNGNLDRNQAIWQQLLASQPGKILYAYVIGSPNQPEGYGIFTQHCQANNLTINLKDWAVLTTAAAKRFWTFLADHRSQVNQVRWQSSALNPWMLLLPEQTANIVNKEHWMLRIINLPLALAQRGYPLGIETQLHLKVKDDLIAANNGKFCLKVSEGRGEVTPGGKGELQLDIRGLAPLYSGLFTPDQLQLMGYLKATKEALLAAKLLFSGSEPWMPDFF